MNYANIKYWDIANGPGIRTSLFVSGCHFHCKNCFNSVAWDKNYGEPFTKEVENTVVASLNFGHVDGVTFLGGEPFEPYNIAGLVKLAKRIRKHYPNKTIWCYTGFTFEELKENPLAIRLIKQLDVLVDGPFIEELKDISLVFKGSSNQRIIDIPETLKQNKIILKM